MPCHADLFGAALHNSGLHYTHRSAIISNGAADLLFTNRSLRSCSHLDLDRPQQNRTCHVQRSFTGLHGLGAADLNSGAVDEELPTKHTELPDRIQVRSVCSAKSSSPVFSSSILSDLVISGATDLM